MAAGYFVQGSCLKAADAGLSVCQRLYPVASISGTTTQARSCTSVSGVGPVFTLTENVCASASCTVVTVPYTLQACDTSDAYSAMLVIFAGFVGASGILFGLRKVYRWLAGDGLAYGAD